MSTNTGKRYSRHLKIRVCRVLAAKQMTYLQASWKYHVHTNALYQWMKEYRVAGDDAFKTVRIKRTLHNQYGYRTTGKLEPREIAMIRYGMMGLNDDQVAALFGKTRSYIWQVRNGDAGGPVAAPPTPPKVRSKAEANHWFIHKAIKTLEAWMALLEQIEKEDDPDIEQNLREADDEGQPQRKARSRRSTQRRPADHSDAGRAELPGAGGRGAPLPEGSGPAEPEVRSGQPGGDQPVRAAHEQPALSPPDPGQHAAGHGPHGAGTGSDAYDRGVEGLIRRRRW